MFAILGLESLPAAPTVLVTGLTIAAGFSVLAALAFVAAERVFDDSATRLGDAGAERDGDDRRRVEIRAFLESIDEPYREHHEIADRTVAFYLPERDVAVTFDPRTYFRIERARVDGTPDAGDSGGTRAVLCEHEMPGRNLGARLPFDVPTVGDARAWRTSRDVRDAYAELGLTPEADVEAVRRAYRERVKDAHPDHGGSERAFKRVRDAYATASTHAADDAVDDRPPDGAPHGPHASPRERHRRDERRNRTAGAHAR